MTGEIHQSGSSQKDKKSSETIKNSGYQNNISAEEIQNYDLHWFKGRIVLVDNLAAFNSVIPALLKEKYLGFDTETKPSFRKGHKNKVSLIQFSTVDTAYLFRINKIGFPGDLSRILADAGITKIGVAVRDDIRYLRTLKKFNPDGFVDLQNYVKEFGIESSGLKKLTAIILGFRISKRQQVTDWEAKELTEAQQIYAATDAWVCREIYMKLNNNDTVAGRK
ncbi:MAG: 3'-5' exonuclease domain-containing protein 2 [Bacteroidales bacterium]|jgi:ribonuclease D|nr:3'-5' exonuclease domain-containing protein 2 [Bacteroidales bacterium]NMD03274.1 3'-5' exonuclease domain-containing protein 2 [Bacteroidales bacterium]HOU02615.1 3'-5' exonuclease [Bacteroidales bacterium]HQK67600.1 3'-5' exonuclease [Bacteroidales bacterium]